MTEPTKREKGLLDAKSAIINAARELDMAWPITMLNNPMVTADKDVLCRTYRYDMAKLRQAAAIIDSILINVDGFATMFELASKKPMEFQALVVLAQVELERKPEAVAA